MQGKGIPPLAVSCEHLVLGMAVREVRARRGMTQEGLAFHSGLHRNYVGALERGEANPTFSTLLKALGGLRVSLIDLAEVYDRQLADAG
jgi:transcriptional regulator with XRE-family HTH domain